jgi:hypothetical protein
MYKTVFSQQQIPTKKRAHKADINAESLPSLFLPLKRILAKINKK